jgi:hypothetical protein
MEKIIKHELRESGSEQSIVFHIVGDAGGGNDDYGRARPTNIIKAFDIQYSMDDMKKINWENLGDVRLENLGHVSEIQPAGATVAQRYCAKHREYSQIFCDNF